MTTIAAVGWALFAVATTVALRLSGRLRAQARLAVSRELTIDHQTRRLRRMHHSALRCRCAEFAPFTIVTRPPAHEPTDADIEVLLAGVAEHLRTQP